MKLSIIVSDMSNLNCFICFFFLSFNIFFLFEMLVS